MEKNIIWLKAKEFRKLTEEALKKETLRRNNEKRVKSKNLKKYFWIEFIKDNYEDIKKAKEKRKLLEFFLNLQKLEDFERFKISFAYFTKLIREYENKLK